jgi:hypothetical protein
VHVANGRTLEGDSDIFQLQVEFLFDFPFGHEQGVIQTDDSFFGCQFAVFPHNILLKAVQMSNYVWEQPILSCEGLPFISKLLVFKVDQLLWTVLVLNLFI